MPAVALILLLVAFTLIHLLAGGVVPAYALPGYVLCGVAAIAGSFARLSRRPVPRWVPVGLMVALAVYVSVRAWLGPVEYLGRADVILMLACLAVYLLVAMVITTPAQRLWLVGLLVVLGLAATAMGAYQFLGRPDATIFGFERPTNYGRRASGFYMCPNHLAGFLEVVIPLVLSLAVFGRSTVGRRLLLGYLSLMMLTGLAITGSRGGYLSMLAGLLVFGCLALVVVGRRIPERLPGVFLSLLAAGALLVVGGSAAMKQSSLLKLRVDALVDMKNMRLQMWQAAWQQFRESPVIGTGGGTYLYYGRYFRPWGGYKEDPIYAHGDWQQLLGEYGALGAALVLAMLAAHLGSGMRVVVGSGLRPLQDAGWGSDSLALTVGSLSALAAQAAHAVVDFNLHIPANALPIAVLFGILANSGRAGPDSRSARSKLPMGRLLLLGCGGLVLAVGIPRLLPEYWAEKARVALAKNGFQEAAEAAKRGLRFDQTNPELHAILGEARLYRSAEFPEGGVRNALLRGAVADLRQAVRLFPGDVWRWISLGQALDGLELWEEAGQAYAEAVRNDPSSGMVYAYLALHLERQGRVAEAMAMFEFSGQVSSSALASEGMARMQSAQRLAPPTPPARPPAPEPQ